MKFTDNNSVVDTVDTLKQELPKTVKAFVPKNISTNTYYDNCDWKSSHGFRTIF